MSTANSTRRDADAQARAQLASIREMVEALTKARQRHEITDSNAACKAMEEAEQRIHEDALCSEVRSGWHVPGREADNTPEEFRILLCTGGPAVQIVGTLNQYCEPETVDLQSQGWFIPWRSLKLKPADRDVLLTYARCFYFGEG